MRVRCKVGFIEIKENRDGITITETIRIEDLLKMFKCEGDMGDGIGFEFFDRIANKRRQFMARYPNTYIRDVAWDEYQKELNTVRTRERTGLSSEYLRGEETNE